MISILSLAHITGQLMQVCIIVKTAYSLINQIKNIHIDLSNCGISIKTNKNLVYNVDFNGL